MFKNWQKTMEKKNQRRRFIKLLLATFISFPIAKSIIGFVNTKSKSYHSSISVHIHPNAVERKMKG